MIKYLSIFVLKNRIKALMKIKTMLELKINPAFGKILLETVALLFIVGSVENEDDYSIYGSNRLPLIVE